MSAELDHIWSQVQLKLQDAVDEPVHRIWLEPLRAVDLHEGQLTVQCPPHACGWVRERFGRLLQTCAAAVLGPQTGIDVIPAANGSNPGARERRSLRTDAGVSRRTAAPHEPSETADERQSPLSPPPANPKLTFDQFVIGDSNRLAHAAALTVSELPAQAYNPLFICGPPGVGKTHLLGAISSLMAAHSPGLVVRCTTGEAFTSEFLQALAAGRLDSFKAGFRRLDVLLMDDVQFLERKARTEEEFFHTFNALYDAGAQIVLTSDRPPADLQALEDRLRERFQAGLVADICPPDLPTRLTILRKRASYDGVRLQDDEALLTIAERVSHNVRSLEGALIRVVAYSSLTGRSVTASLAQEVLDGLYPKAEPPVRSIADIKAAACEQFGISGEELVSASRSPRVSWPRQVAMYLARELTCQSLPAIGREFGGRDHTTVLHAWKATEKRITSNPESKAAVESLKRRLQTHP